MVMRKNIPIAKLKRGRYYRLKKAKENYKPYKQPYIHKDFFIPASISFFPTGEGDIDKYYFVKDGVKRADQIKVEIENMGFKCRNGHMNIEEVEKLLNREPLPCFRTVEQVNDVDVKLNIFKIIIKGVKNYVTKLSKITSR